MVKALESNCLKYLQHDLLLRGCEVLAPKTEPSRASDTAEIYACESVARCSWTSYFCGKPADGLLSYDIGWFSGFVEAATCVSTKVKLKHDAITDKLANIRINARQLVKLPPRWSEKRESNSFNFVPTGRRRNCAEILLCQPRRMNTRRRTPSC